MTRSGCPVYRGGETTRKRCALYVAVRRTQRPFVYLSVAPFAVLSFSSLSLCWKAAILRVGVNSHRDLTLHLCAIFSNVNHLRLFKRLPFGSIRLFIRVSICSSFAFSFFSRSSPSFRSRSAAKVTRELRVSGPGRHPIRCTSCHCVSPTVTRPRPLQWNSMVESFNLNAMIYRCRRERSSRFSIGSISYRLAHRGSRSTSSLT